MNYTQISLKYRPRSFADIAGQRVSVRILKNSLLMDRLPKAVLFSGIRGTGKTTLARLYAQALNCPNFNGDVCNNCPSCREALNGTHPDIVEFDAASNNGVDFIRDLANVFKQVESFKKRVIIFDEIHMFTPQAQAALLKTLEEPPENLTFLLSTTDPDRLSDTIRSRCLSMPLKPLIPSEISANLRSVIAQEGREASEDFVETLALQGGGSLRDVQQILDQVMLASGEGPLDLRYLEEAIGIVSVSMYKKLAAVLSSWDMKIALSQVDEWYASGMDLELLYLEGLPVLLRDFSMVLSSMGSVAPMLTGISVEIFESKLNLSLEQVKYISTWWEKYCSMMKSSGQPKVVWAIFFVSVFGGGN